MVCPSERVIDTLRGYGVVSPMRIIPTGIEVEKFRRPDITAEMKKALRQQLAIEENQPMLLSLSRISYEKNIQAIIDGMPEILASIPDAKLVIVGKGPHKEKLEEKAAAMQLSDHIYFVGEVPNDEVAIYYHAADYFVSASTSETQGLTYTEAMAAGTPLVVEGNDYLNTLIDDPSLGVTYQTDQDFAKTFIDYFQQQIPADSEVLARKLYEISALRFGESMLSFYHDMVAYYETTELEKETEQTLKKFKVKLKSFRRSVD